MSAAANPSGASGGPDTSAAPAGNRSHADRGTARHTVDLLTGPAVEPLLRAALATSGGELVEWSVRQVDHRPGHRTTASFGVRARWGDRVTSETLGACCYEDGRILRPDTRVPPPLVLGDGTTRVSLWRFPNDPSLPGLPAATSRSQVASLLRSLGIRDVDQDGHDVTLRTRTYRPRRRAVIEATFPGGRVFLKVLRPEKVEDTHRRHRVLADAGVPVPASWGWSPEGIVVLAPQPGMTLREAIRHGAALPDAPALLDILGRFPPSVSGLRRRRPWVEHVDHYARVIGSVLDSEAVRVRELAAHISQSVTEGDGDEPTHGDFYDAQILVQDGRITGLLDVDTAGPGRRVDDVACLLAHADVLGEVGSADPDVVSHVVMGWRAGFERVLDPRDLRIRAAGVLLSLATGPHRCQEKGWEQATTQRLDRVESWLVGA